MFYESIMIILSLVILFAIYKMQPELSIEKKLTIQGMRIRASLDDIYNKIIPTQKIDLIAILSSSRQVIWSDEVQLHLSSEYYEPDEYILILRNPTHIDLSELPLYEKQVTDRIEYILRRRNVFVSFTNEKGESLNSLVQGSLQIILIIVSAFLGLAAILYILKRFRKS